jgi:uncharacterized protein (TIGR03067 family)
VTQTLTTRPNLEHLRGQAKTLLAELRAGDAKAARTFIDHLPKARGMSGAQARAAGFRLADAQSVVARRTGFASWNALTRHVEQLRALEGEWRFASLQIDGNDMPRALIAPSRVLIDGDRFQMQSPEASYDGRFTIDISKSPSWIDIEFVEGPDAGHASRGIFELDGDHLTICLGVVGASRPAAFETKPASGHALEHLRRASAARPTGVTGGVAAPMAEPAASQQPVDPAEFAASTHSLFPRLEGSWVPVRLVMNQEEMRADWPPFGSRTGDGERSQSRIRRPSHAACENADRRQRRTDCRGLSPFARGRQGEGKPRHHGMARRRSEISHIRAGRTTPNELCGIGKPADAESVEATRRLPLLVRRASGLVERGVLHDGPRAVFLDGEPEPVNTVHHLVGRPAGVPRFDHDCIPPNDRHGQRDHGEFLRRNAFRR